MRVILPQESQSLDGGHEIIGAGQRLSKARERIPRARDEASHAIEHPGSRFWSALNPTNSDWPYGHSSASIQRRILMLPGDDEASVFTDGAYCQRRSDSYARGPIPPTLRCPGMVFQDAGQIVAVSDGVVPHSARWTYSSARALARAICSARFICAASSRLPPSKSSMRSRIAGAIEPGSLGGSDPSGPRASRRSPADLCGLLCSGCNRRTSRFARGA